MSLDATEIGLLRRCALHQSQGLAQGWRLIARTVRMTGRAAAVSINRQGRFVDYSIVISAIRREPSFRARETSPAVRLAIVPEFTGTKAYDRRLADLAQAFAIMGLYTRGGQVAIVPRHGARFVFAGLHSGSGSERLTAARIEEARRKAAAGEPALPLLRLVRSLEDYYRGFHIVVLTPYWDPLDVLKVTRQAGTGLTLGILEPRSFAGSWWLGGAVPHVLVRERVRQRLAQLKQSCGRCRANYLHFPARGSVAKTLIRHLQHDARL